MFVKTKNALINNRLKVSPGNPPFGKSLLSVKPLKAWAQTRTFGLWSRCGAPQDRKGSHAWRLHFQGLRKDDFFSDALFTVKKADIALSGSPAGSDASPSRIGSRRNLEIESIERELSIGDFRVDLVATVRIKEQRRRLALEIKSSGQPRIARSAAYQLARLREQALGLYGVFAAPYISPQTAEICTQEKLGYLDLARNWRLTFGRVYIEQTGMPNPYAEKRDLRSLYSPKAARVLRVLLTDPRKAWRVQPLADEADVSQGLVSNVKSLLKDRERLRESEAGFLLKEPGSLLAEWAANNKAGKMAAESYYTLKGVAEFEAALAQTCEQAGIPYALTGFSGAARYTPAVRYQRAMAYVESDTERIAAQLSLKRVESGANVSLYSPPDKGVFYGARTIGGISVASPLQVYLDLVGVKGRGEETADALLEEVIKRSW